MVRCTAWRPWQQRPAHPAQQCCPLWSSSIRGWHARVHTGPGCSSDAMLCGPATVHCCNAVEHLRCTSTLTGAVCHGGGVVAVHIARRHAVPAPVGGDAEGHIGDRCKLVAVLQAKGRTGAAVLDVSRMVPREAVPMLSQHVWRPACDITGARARPRTAPSRAQLAMKMPFVASTMLTCHRAAKGRARQSSQCSTRQVCTGQWAQRHLPAFSASSARQQHGQLTLRTQQLMVSYMPMAL